jgi:hypothetical protein
MKPPENRWLVSQEITMPVDRQHSDEGSQAPLEIPLPPGAVFPDWSVVTSDRVRSSLNDTLGKLRMTTRWVGIGDEEETLRETILRLYAMGGVAPSCQALANETGFSLSVIFSLLRKLEKRDLIVIGDTDCVLKGAYPFTDLTTEHKVHVNKVGLNAMCAIDALGVGAMLGKNTVIESTCRQCGREINIQTKDRGRAIHKALPDGVIVWAGVQDIDGCAADTQCTVMAFFCSDEHLALWGKGNAAGARGHRLSTTEGLEAGAAIFIPFLAEATAKPVSTEGLR